MSARARQMIKLNEQLQGIFHDPQGSTGDLSRRQKARLTEIKAEMTLLSAEAAAARTPKQEAQYQEYLALLTTKVPT